MNSFNRRTLIKLAAGFAATRAPAFAQTGEHFPSNVVRIIIANPPGGPADSLARLLAEQLGEKWGRPVIVESKPGGFSTIATQAVATAPADGHTLGLVAGAHMTNPYLFEKLPYDTLGDLTGVSMVTRTHIAMYAHPSFPASTPAEVIALAKSRAEPILYGSVTPLTTLGMEMLNRTCGIRMKNVGYKGTADSIRDLMGGHLQVLVDPVTGNTLEHVKSGKIKLIGTFGLKPSPFTPDAPVFASVAPGFELVSAFGLITRNGTPPALLRKIGADVAAAVSRPEVGARIRALSQEPVGSTPEDYNTYIAREMKKWESIVKTAGIKVNQL